MRLIPVIFLFLSSLLAQGQNTYDLIRVQLDSVTVKGIYTGNTREAGIGTRVSTISARVLEGNQTKSLSELLSDNTMVYIKSLGQGALATSSFRGTSSSHTQVNWNGINITPSMSGNFDFSQVPVFFADNVTLYHGSSFLKNGSGALGGSINISNTPDWNSSTRLRAFAEYGAWNSMTFAAAVRSVKAKALYQTRAYYQSSDNDYRYLNKVLSKDPFYENRKEAEYRQTGVMQEAYFRPSENGTISTNLWFQYGDRRLPQPIVVYTTQHEKQKNTSLKYFLGYRHQGRKQVFSVKGAYLLDYLDYRKWFDNNFSGSKNYNTAQTVNLSGNYSYNHSPRFSVDASLMYNYDFIKAASYSVGHVDRRVVSLQGNMLWLPVNWLTLNLQMMGEVNNGRFAPTFTAGLSAQLIDNLLLFKANTAYNYRYPSLNDLYWEPGGNPGLMPEKGFSYDATLSFTPRINGLLYFKADMTYYAMNIDNWIMWLPTQDWYWRPTNVMNVLSHGFELLTECNLIIGDFRAKAGVNYSYSPSINRERRFNDDDSYRKQLPYIPKQKANFRLGADYKNLFLSYQVCYTGLRYTTNDESYKTDAYTVHDTEIGYHLHIRNRYKLIPKLRINNLFNEYYESTQFYPMPLRNISGSITFSF